MRIGLIILFLSISSVLSSQAILTIEGRSYVNTQTDWNGVVISNSTPTTFTFRNNSITSQNNDGYMLLAGDEATGSTNQNLDGAVITGNKLLWKGSTHTSLHNIMVGYNINDVIKYNYIEGGTYGVVFKSGTGSSDKTYTAGGLAYNIFKNCEVAVRIKGVNGIPIYNNTFYDNEHNTNVNALIYIDPYSGGGTGTKLKNNIFYVTNHVASIFLADGAEVGFESDFNVFYCGTGGVTFYYKGVGKTFSEWQALGYDKHSVVLNPNFKDFTDFVPTIRLDYGMDLGTSWQTGLSTNAVWTLGDSPATVNQNGTWQVGARVYDASPVAPYYISSVIENNTPGILIMTYTLSLASIAPSASAFSVLVNSVPRIINSVAISGNKALLTLASSVKFGDVVTVSYTKPIINPLQTTSGGQSISISAQQVINNIINTVEDATPVAMIMTIFPNHIHRIINVMLKYSSSFSVLDPVRSPQIIRIFDTSGKLYIEKLVVTGVANITIPVNLKSGIYSVLMFSGGLQMASQKILVY